MYAAKNIMRKTITAAGMIQTRAVNPWPGSTASGVKVAAGSEMSICPLTYYVHGGELNVTQFA